MFYSKEYFTVIKLLTLAVDGSPHECYPSCHIYVHSLATGDQQLILDAHSLIVTVHYKVMGEFKYFLKHLQYTPLNPGIAVFTFHHMFLNVTGFLKGFCR